MGWRRVLLRIGLSLLLLGLLAYRVVPAVRNMEAYRSYWNWEFDPMGWQPAMLPWMLLTLALTAAAFLVVRWGPFLVIGLSILANWMKPPRGRRACVLCICACFVVFLGEGFFYAIGWLTGTLQPWQKPLVNLLVALADGAGVLLASGRGGRGQHFSGPSGPYSG